LELPLEEDFYNVILSCYFIWKTRHWSCHWRKIFIMLSLVAISYGRPGIGAATGGRLLDPENGPIVIDNTVLGLSKYEIQAFTLLATLCGSGGIVGGGIGSMIGNEVGSQVGDAVFNLSLLSELTEFVGTGAGALTGSLAAGLTCDGLFGPNVVVGRR